VVAFAFGLAAGAMFFLVLSEMIPESRADSSERLTSALATMAGFLLLMNTYQPVASPRLLNSISSLDEGINPATARLW